MHDPAVLSYSRRVSPFANLTGHRLMTQTNIPVARRTPDVVSQSSDFAASLGQRRCRATRLCPGNERGTRCRNLTRSRDLFGHLSSSTRRRKPRDRESMHALGGVERNRADEFNLLSQQVLDTVPDGSSIKITTELKRDSISQGMPGLSITIIDLSDHLRGNATRPRRDRACV